MILDDDVPPLPYPSTPLTTAAPSDLALPSPKELDYPGHPQHLNKLGPAAQRRCTDLLFYLLFLAACLVMVVTIILGFLKGDPNKLWSAKDFHGFYCGSKGPMKDYPYVLYTLNLDRFFEAHPAVKSQSFEDWIQEGLLSKEFGSLFTRICVKFHKEFDSYCPSQAGILAWMKTCEDKHTAPLQHSDVTSFERSPCRLYKHTKLNFSIPALRAASCPYGAGRCILLFADYLHYLDRYCVPKLVKLNPSKAVQGIWNYVPESTLGNWGQYWGAMKTVWPLFPVIGFIALVLAVAYLVIVQFFAEVVVFVAAVVILVSFVSCGLAFFFISIDTSYSLTGAERDTMYYFSFVLWGVSAIYTGVMVCLCRTLKEGAAMLQCACQFLTVTPTVYLVPLAFWFVTLVWFCVWVIGATFVISIDSRPKEEVIGFFVFDIFMFLWIFAFFLASSQMVLSGSVIWWYFSPETSTGIKVAKLSPLKATWVVLRYHQGTLAFGSLVLALVKLIKWFLRWLKRQAQLTTSTPDQEVCAACLPFGLGACCGLMSCANSSFVWFIWIFSYLVECFERCVEYINSSAYEQTMLYGYNFYGAALSAFRLMASNASKFAIAAYMTAVLRWMGALAIIAVTTVLGWFITVRIYGDRIISPFMPTVAYCGIAIIVANVFLDVLSTTVNATLRTYLADCEENGGTAQYAPLPVRSWIASVEERRVPIAGTSCCYCCVDVQRSDTLNLPK